MSIEEVLERSRIELPEKINLREAEKLLRYIAKKLPAEIQYTLLCNKLLYRDKNKYFKSSFSFTPEINGRINYLKDSRAFDVFQFKSLKEDGSKLDIMQFQTVPEWELNEYRQEIKQLWDDTRKIVYEYFLKKRY